MSAPTNETPRRERNSARLYVLDLLRFIAAVIVVGHHLVATLPYEWGPEIYDAADLFGHPLTSFFRYGWIGVEFFFVISGFVICMSSWGRTVSDFFVSRVARLFPGYLVAVLITAGVSAAWPYRSVGVPINEVLANLSMMQGFLGKPHLDWSYWTLVIELKFYLLFAIVVAFGVTYRRVLAFCMVWVTASLIASVSGDPLVVALLEPRFTPFFVAGIVLFLMHRFGANALHWAMLLMTGLIASSSLYTHVNEQKALYGESALSQWIAFLWMAVFMAVMIAIALGWFSWVRWRGLVALGALTYPLYLLHHKIGMVLISQFGPRIAPQLLVTLLVVGFLMLSWLIHQLAERPAGRWIKRQLTQAFATIHRQSRDDTAHLETGSTTDRTVMVKSVPLFGVEASTGSIDDAGLTAPAPAIVHHAIDDGIEERGTSRRTA